MLIGLSVLCVVLVIALLLVGNTLARTRREALEEAEALRERVAALEVDLDSALRPRPAATTTERAMRRVVRTVDRVRTRGFAGMLQASIDELQHWAADERADILNMADAHGIVTLLFSDIEDSTTINQQLGDDAWVRTLAAHDAVLRTQIDKYRGQVVKTAGDGFMVAFRDAEAACLAALGVQKDLRRSMDSRLRGIRVRIGVHTGQVVARDGDYFGRNVAMAARVSDLAQGGEVLASDAVRETLDEDASVVLEEMALAQLKGFAGEHTIWRVLRK